MQQVYPAEWLDLRTEFLKSQEKAKQNFMGVKSAKTRGEGCSCIEGGS